jgi:hypothetical protein
MKTFLPTFSLRKKKLTKRTNWNGKVLSKEIIGRKDVYTSSIKR